MGQSKTERRKSYRLGLASKAVVIPMMLIVASGMTFTYLTSALNEYFDAQRIVRLSQDQEVLAEQYLKNSLLSVGSIPVSPANSAEQLARDLDTILTAGSRSDSEAHHILNHINADSSLMMMLENQKKSLSDLTASVDAYVAQANKDKFKSRLFKDLYASAQALQMTADEAVRVYDQHLDTNMPWWDVDAVAVELSERQRMRVQQHIKEVLFALNGIETDYVQSRDILYKSLALLATGGTVSLSPEETVSLPAPQYEDIQYVLAQQKKSLDAFGKAAEDYLAIVNSSTQLVQSLKKASDELSYYTASARQLADRIALHYKTQLSEVRNQVFVVAGIAFLFLLILFWQFVGFLFLKPASQIRQAISRLGEGDTSVHIAKIRNDETGDLSAELNRAAKKMSVKTQMLNRYAEGDDSVDFASTAPHDKLGQAINKSLTRLRDAIEESKRELESLNQDITKELSGRDDDFEVIGNLPGTQVSISEKDLFQQLLDRANQLRLQQEELLEVNNSLRSENDRLAELEREVKDKHEKLSMRNLELEQLVNQNDLQFEKQRQEIETLSSSLQQKEAQLSQINTEVMQGAETLTAKTLRQTQEISRKAEELRQLAGQVEVKELRLTQLQELIDEREGRVSRESDGFIDESVEKLYDKVQQQAVQIADFKKQLDDRAAEYADRSAELDKVRKALHITKQDLETSKALMNEQSEKIESYQKELTEVRSRAELLAEVRQELQKAKEELEEKSRAQLELKEELEEKRKTQLELQERHSAAKKLLEEDSVKRQTLENEAKENARHIQTLELDIHTARTRVQQLEAECSGKETQIRKYEQDMATLSAAAAKANQLQARVSHIEGLIQVKEQAAKAAEERLQVTRKALAAALEELQDKNAG